MKKWLGRIVGIALLILGICTIIFIYYKRQQYSIETEKPAFTGLSPKDTVLRIGLIGDSWVAWQQIDTFIIDKIRGSGINCKVYSSGQPGAYTKHVYQNIFKDPRQPYSSKSVIIANPGYCCIISGNNDVGTDVGVSFYSEHLMLIIKLLCHYNIKPVVVSIAQMETNIPRPLCILKKIKRTLKGFFIRHEKHSVEEYNRSFTDLLSRSAYRDKVLIIDMNYEPGEKEYVDYRDLFIKPYHLTAAGRNKLGNKIAEIILKDHMASRHQLTSTQ